MYIHLTIVKDIMEALKSDLAKLKQLTAVVEYDIDNLDRGVKAASTRARTKLMAISKLCGTMRKQCMTAKNDLPSKSRGKKAVEPEPEIDGVVDGVEDIEEMPEPLVLQRETTSTSPGGVKSKKRAPRKPRRKAGV